MAPVAIPLDSPSRPTYPARRLVVLVLVGLSIAGLATTVWVFLAESGSGTASLMATPSTPPTAAVPSVLFAKDGVWPTAASSIITPQVLAAANARIGEDEEVIGIALGGEHRAYLVAALSRRPDFHIVNDLIAGRPLTVTYCDIARCARAFTSEERGEPLDISVAGLHRVGAQLVLKVGERMYLQKTGAALGPESETASFPYPTHDLIQTTWGRWRRSHPDTTVYVGPESKR